MRSGCRWWLLMGLAAGDAGAQAVYRCAASQGTAYQSLPCAGVELQHWKRADLIAVPGPRVGDEVARRAIERTRKAWQASLADAAPRTWSRGHRPRIARPVSRPARERPVNACERARKARAAAHARRGLRWSFDDASRWDAAVFKVCRWG